MLRGLIFDVDGTLAETEELHRVSFNQAFAARGLDWHWDAALYGRLLEVTGGKERIAHFQQGRPDPVSPSQIAALHADKTARYARAVAAGGIALRPGVRALAQQARAAGVKLGIATTTSRPNVDALLAATGFPPPDVIAAGDEVAQKKPAPDIYRLALDRLSLPPEACVAIEDTVNGLRSALGAGIACVITKSSYGGDGPFAGALAVLDDLSRTGLAELERP